MGMGIPARNFKYVLYILKIYGIIYNVPKLRNVIIWSANSKTCLCEIASSIISPRER
jgi:hypothetical protein